MYGYLKVANLAHLEYLTGNVVCFCNTRKRRINAFEIEVDLIIKIKDAKTYLVHPCSFNGG